MKDSNKKYSIDPKTGKPVIRYEGVIQSKHEVSGDLSEQKAKKIVSRTENDGDNVVDLSVEHLKYNADLNKEDEE